MGPPDPFSEARERDQLSRLRHTQPYGGLGEPRNPFAPGGAGNATQIGPWRTSNLDARYDQEEQQRRDRYRSQLGEPWGVAANNEYEQERRARRSRR